MKYIRHWLAWIFPTAVRHNSRTVRYAFSFMFVFAAIASLAAVVATDASYVRLEVSAQEVLKDSQFTVTVYAFAHVPVNAVDVALQFPEATVEVLGIDRGESVITLWTEDPYVENNKVYLSGGTYQKGFLGEHVIAKIRLQAKEAGKADFLVEDLRLLAGDGRGTQVKTVAGAGTVSAFIYDENTDPAIIAGAAELILITDIDNDGRISLRDISMFMSAWAGQGQVYDFNNDSRMTFRDFSIILASYFFQNR